MFTLKFFTPHGDSNKIEVVEAKRYIITPLQKDAGYLITVYNTDSGYIGGVEYPVGNKFKKNKDSGEDVNVGFMCCYIENSSGKTIDKLFRKEEK